MHALTISAPLTHTHTHSLSLSLSLSVSLSLLRTVVPPASPPRPFLPHRALRRGGGGSEGEDEYAYGQAADDARADAAIREAHRILSSAQGLLASGREHLLQPHPTSSPGTGSRWSPTAAVARTKATPVNLDFFLSYNFCVSLFI